MRVPRWRTIMVPPGTSCPPKALTPSRCAFESRPFLELPKPFLCAISESFSANSNWQLAQKPLLLLPFTGLPACAPLGFRLASGRGFLVCSSFRFVRMGFAFRLGLHLTRRHVRRAELLAVKFDFRDAHCGKRLAMAENLLVLLFALEVEDQDLVTASGFHDFAAHYRALARADVAFLAGHSQDIVELDGVAFAGGQLLNLDYVSGSNSILLPSGAYHRVHNTLHGPFEALGRKGLK